MCERALDKQTISNVYEHWTIVTSVDDDYMLKNTCTFWSFIECDTGNIHICIACWTANKHHLIFHPSTSSLHSQCSEIYFIFSIVSFISISNGERKPKNFLNNTHQIIHSWHLPFAHANFSYHTKYSAFEMLTAAATQLQIACKINCVLNWLWADFGVCLQAHARLYFNNWQNW